jgi:hypothetical protein
VEICSGEGGAWMCCLAEQGVLSKRKLYRDLENVLGIKLDRKSDRKEEKGISFRSNSICKCPRTSKTKQKPESCS